MDQEKVRRTSMNPPTMVELLATAERLENAKNASDCLQESLDYCGDLCCYLMAHVLPLGNNVLTAAPLAAALRVIADTLAGSVEKVPGYAEAVDAYYKIQTARSEVITVRVPKGGRHE